MSVDNVQSFGAWVASLPSEQKAGKTITELRSQYNAAIAKSLVGHKQGTGDVGTKVEQTTPGEGDAATREARAKANQGNVSDVAAMKAQAGLTPEQKVVQEAHDAQVKRSGKKKAGEYAPVEFTLEERAIVEQAVTKSGKDKPLYQNKKAQKELTNHFYTQFTSSDTYEEQKAAIAGKYNEDYSAAQAFGDTEEQARIYQSYQSELGALDNAYKSAAKNYAKSFVRRDRIEHTRVFETEADKKAFKKENDTDGLRLKVHHDKYIGGQNVSLHNQDAVKKDGISLHQAAYEKASDTIGSDKVGDPNEVHHLADEAALRTKYRPVEKELKRLGYDVKDDTWKNIAKALIPGAGAFAGAAAFTTTAHATAKAFAVVQNPSTGEILASSTSFAEASKTMINWAGAGAAGAAASVLTAALFGETEDEHVLNGTDIGKVFQPSVDGKKYYQTSTFGKYTEQTKIVLEAIDKLDLTDEQKTEVLRQAAGIDSRQFLSSKELICAYMAAEEISKVEKPDPVDPVDPVDPNPVVEEKPEYRTDITETPKTKVENTETKLRHISNLLYGDVMAREGYVRSDGKPFTEDQIKEIWRDIYGRSDFNAKTGWKAPKFWILGNKVPLKDGTFAIIKSEDELLKIRGKASAADPKLGFTHKTRNVKTETRVVGTKYGYKVEKKEVGSDEWKEVANSGSTYYESYDKADEAAQKVKGQLESAEKDKK